MLKRVIFYIGLGMLAFFLKPMVTQAETECQTVKKKKVKVEG